MDVEDQRRSCPGFLDQYGIWNNGFECPSLSNQIRVCCGSDSDRYCCLLESLPINSSKRSFSNTNDLLKKLHRNFLTLPVQLLCLLVLIVILLIVLTVVCYRFHQRRRNHFQRESISGKSEYFPFSPPHHQLYSNNPNQQRTISTSSVSDTFNIYPIRSSNDYEKHHHDGLIV